MSDINKNAAKDIIEEYGLDYMECVVIDTDDETAERIEKAIKDLNNAGVNLFPEAKTITRFFDNDELDTYTEETIERFASDMAAEGASEYFPSPEWLVTISNTGNGYADMGEREVTWEDCVAYFDTSFGNYLPDYKEYTREFTVYLDLGQDGVFLTSKEFFENIVNPILRNTK